MQYVVLVENRASVHGIPYIRNVVPDSGEIASTQRVHAAAALHPVVGLPCAPKERVTWGDSPCRRLVLSTRDNEGLT